MGRLFPLVLANLLPEEFLAARRGVLAKVAPGGRLVLSGLPLDAEEKMLARLRSRRWRLAGRRAEGQWACVCLERAS